MSLDDFKLPLRLLGLKNLPAVPVDIKGMIETLAKLDIRSKEALQATQSLTKIFTIGEDTAPAHAFLYGGEPIGGKATQARERMKKLLGGNPLTLLQSLVERLREESHELFDDLLGDDTDESVDLTKLSLDDPEQWTMSWTTLPDVVGDGEPYREQWVASVDVRKQQVATAEFWPTIAQFGLAYNLILPKKISNDTLAEVRELFPGRVDSLEKAATQGLLYAIDLRIYEALEPQQVDGSTRFTPGTYTVLVQDPVTKSMTPELIRVSGHEGAGVQIFSRPLGLASRQEDTTTDAAWVYALLAAKTSVTVYGIWFGHVYHWHLVTAAMQMTMFDELSSDHPVRILLDPQSDYLIPFDDVLLVLWRFIAPPTSIKTGWQFLELADLYAKDREFFDDDPTTTLENLGITWRDFSSDDKPENRWDRYPIVGDLLKIWEATGKYVGTYVDQTYATDKDVRDDTSLQDWIEASGKKRCGNVRGLPEMDSKAALVRVLHSLIYRVTAHGVGRLYRVANPALTFVANFPPTLQDSQIPEPSSHFDTQTLLRFLPKTGSIAGMVTFYFTFSFSVPYEPFVPVEGIDTHLYLEDDVSNAALVELRRFIAHFIATYEPDTPQTYQWPLNIET